MSAVGIEPTSLGNEPSSLPLTYAPYYYSVEWDLNP